MDQHPLMRQFPPGAITNVDPAEVEDVMNSVLNEIDLSRGGFSGEPFMEQRIATLEAAILLLATHLSNLLNRMKE